MAMKKTEMEYDYSMYHDLMREARRLESQGLFFEATKKAYDAWQFVDGMMRYARKYHEKEFSSVESIEFVLKYAPLMFDFESLEGLGKLLKSNKSIEKNTSVCLADRLNEARELLKTAHRLWNFVELHPNCKQDLLRAQLGGNQDEYRQIAESWERIGLLKREPDGRSYKLKLWTQMDDMVEAKCFTCGSIQKAPKAMFFWESICPECNTETSFVIL